MDTDIITHHDGMAVIGVALTPVELQRAIDDACATVALGLGVEVEEGSSARRAILAAEIDIEADELDATAERLVVERMTPLALAAVGMQALVAPRCDVDTGSSALSAVSFSGSSSEHSGLRFTMHVIEVPPACISSFEPVTLEPVDVTVTDSELDAQMAYIVSGAGHVEGDYHIVPALTDTWVAANIPDCKTVEQLRRRVRSDMLSRKRDRSEHDRLGRCVAAFTARLEVELPQAAVQQALEEARRAFERSLALSGGTLETYLKEVGITSEELERLQRTDIIEQMRRGIALDLLADHLDMVGWGAMVEDRAARQGMGSVQRRLRASRWLERTAREGTVRDGTVREGTADERQGSETRERR